MKNVQMKSYLALIILISIPFIGCKNGSTSPNNQVSSFSIVLLKDSTLSTAQVKGAPLDSLIINGQSIINISDIIYYRWSDHHIELTSEGFNKFKSVESKIKSTYGLPFIVVASGEKIYLGNIYPSYSSYMHTDIPYIFVAPFTSLDIQRAPDKTIADKRNDPRIYSALESINKLK